IIKRPPLVTLRRPTPGRPHYSRDLSCRPETVTAIERSCSIGHIWPHARARMTSVYRYRKERHFKRPPEAIWPFIADTARVNALAGAPAYSVEERPDAQGRVRRVATARLGPIKLKWEESFGEWEPFRRVEQIRNFLNGPFRRFQAMAELFPEDGGTRLVFSSRIECVGPLGQLARLSGQIAREGDRRLAAIERLIAEAGQPGHIDGAFPSEAPKPAAGRRLAALVGDLERDPASHGLARKLSEFLLHAPVTSLRGIRPFALARTWNAPPEDTVELFLAAHRRGILTMSWDLLCPRCRGAKSQVEFLHDLPREAHCSSCNIDYGRDFTRNVELTFHPQPWLRPLPEGELCMLGQGSTPHVKLQAEVAPHSAKTFALALPPGPYRFRTVEAGGQTDAEIGADGLIPEIAASSTEIAAAAPGHKAELVAHNDTDRPLFFVVEDRLWAKDALTGESVIAMPAFRRLCPEQLLRPGDDVEIGRVAIIFTDLQGSTKL